MNELSCDVGRVPAFQWRSGAVSLKHPAARLRRRQMASAVTSIDTAYWIQKPKRICMAAEPLEPEPAALQAAFREALPLLPNLEPTFKSALQHLLHNPGSMVRPRIVFQVATAYGMDYHSAMDLAVALE